jgi:outer membrane protein OmpA-like peptidoglycan-associated protein
MRLFLGILVFLVWGSICRYGYVCQIKHHCDPEPVEVPRVKTLDLILDDTITFLEDYDQFAFKEGVVEPDMNDNNNAYLDSLTRVMEKDTFVFLTITGLYRPSELGKGSGMFEDLGMARAAEVRKLIAQRGLSEEKISLDSKPGMDEDLTQPLEFMLYSDRGGAPEEYTKIQYTFTNMTFSDANFEKGKSVFKPGEALITYADSVKTYLELNPDKILTIIGHCDTDGTDQYNLELGKDRAEEAKKYFIDLGVVATINTISKGESEPAFPNDSEINMQKNRRVNFVIE